MSDLVGNPEDQFSDIAALQLKSSSLVQFECLPDDSLKGFFLMTK